MFYFDEITQASATPNTQTTEINAGWSLFPVAVLPGQQTFELSLTQGQFNTELFAMAANSHFANDNTYEAIFTETVTFDNTGTAKLSYPPVSGSVWFNGMDSNDTVAIDGRTITVTIVQGPATTDEEYTPNEDAGLLVGDVEITYRTLLSGGADVIYSTNRDSVIGEAFMRWPVYSANADCTDSAIKGYVELHVFRCRVTQAPGFDSSYKSAQTNQVTFSAIDAKRADDAVYSLAYFELPVVESQQGG